MRRAPVVFGILLGLVAAALALVFLSGQGRQRPPDSLSLDRVDPGAWNGPLLGPGVIYLGRTSSIRGTQVVDAEEYVLTMDGLAQNPMSMSFRKILGHPYVERQNVMYCVEGWSWSASWRGLAVRDLLAQVKPKAAAKRVILHAASEYTSSFPIEELQSSDAKVLAYMANGDYLPREEGFPVGPVAEGRWGYKWVTRIDISGNEDHRGYWDSRGYSDRADVT